MRHSLVVRTAAAIALLFVSAIAARAQIYESVGIRAQGMGGAFVAVADDATATWWNPAGLATGAYGNALIEYGLMQEPRVATDAGAALPSWRTNARGLAMAFPAMGLSYYRLRFSEVRPVASTATTSLSREDQGRVPVLSTSLVLQQFGATVGQSVGRHLVLGSTVKVVRGAIGAAVGVAADASLGSASGLGGDTETHLDLDVGLMGKFGAFRVGAAAKNVREPQFGTGADRTSLQRQIRAGLAVTSTQHGTVGPMTFAVDADLSRTRTATGDARHVAAGAEAWVFGRSLGLRGGVSGNTLGAVRPAAGAGLSLALRSGTYLDGAATLGADQERRGWGVALRATF